MPSVIEVAKTGRAKCRACKENIAKDELRFGEEVPSQFGDGESLQWYHLACAAEARPVELQPVLEGYAGDVPNRAELLASLPQNAADIGLQKVQKAERAPTGRASCMQCKQAIGKAEWRVAVERELQTGGVAGMKGSGYLHIACAPAFLQGSKEGLIAKLKKRSALSAADADEITRLLG
jgi:poly [ADP-ribose] polymerase